MAPTVLIGTLAYTSVPNDSNQNGIDSILSYMKKILTENLGHSDWLLWLIFILSSIAFLLGIG